MDNRVYAVRLSLALEPGTRCREILSAFDSPRDIFESDLSMLRMSGAFTAKQIEKIEKSKTQDALNILDICEKNSWKCVTIEDDEYPEDLRRLDDPPIVLYVWGDISEINSSLCFAIVGTREPTPDSVTIARTISAQLADAGALIVSGCALGIDSAAHEGALLAHGRTVAVLGCGLGTRYLMQNAALRNQISENGAVISEYPPFAPASKSSFPIRNRIISGMSKGVLVVEAGEKSGSIVTARKAISQGRDVFAVPGNIVTSAYAGANRLIRDGAVAVTCADDIISEYDSLYPGKLKKSETKKAIPAAEDKPAFVKKSAAALDDKEKAVYAQFEGEPLYPADIASLTGISLGEVNTILTSLEIKDYITTAPGGRFSLI